MFHVERPDYKQEVFHVEQKYDRGKVGSGYSKRGFNSLVASGQPFESSEWESSSHGVVTIGFC